MGVRINLPSFASEVGLAITRDNTTPWIRTPASHPGIVEVEVEVEGEWSKRKPMVDQCCWVLKWKRW